MKLQSVLVGTVVVAGCVSGTQPQAGYYPHPTGGQPPAGDPAVAGPSPDASEPITPDQPMPAQSLSSTVSAQLGVPVKFIVDGRADIFSSGLPSPDTDRGGVMPAIVRLPAGKLAFTVGKVNGHVGCGTGEPPSGPDGGGCAGGSTDIESASGISGIVDHGSTQFIVGVFLADQMAPAAPILNFGKDGQGHEFKALRPALGQTFFIGDGQAGGQPQQFFVPDGATRLAVGIADASGFTGTPGCYSDNTGGFGITLTVAAAPN